MIKSLQLDDVLSIPFIVSNKWHASNRVNLAPLIGDTDFSYIYGTSSIQDESLNSFTREIDTDVFLTEINPHPFIQITNRSTSSFSSQFTNFGNGVVVECEQVYRPTKNLDLEITPSGSTDSQYLIFPEVGVEEFLLETNFSISSSRSPYNGPAFIYNFNAYIPTNDSDCELALEQSSYNYLTVDEGIKVDDNLIFYSDSESKNLNGSYKRLIYAQTKHVFYNDSNDPTKFIGLVSLDSFLDAKRRHIYDTVKVVTIPQSYYGDKIIEGSVQIKENNSDQPYTVVDDGIGNLHVKEKIFSSVQTNTQTKSFEKDLGYSVAVNDTYAIIGNPSFSTFNQSTLKGSVDVYKHNPLKNSNFIYDRTISRSLSGSVSIHESDFGRSIDVCGSICAIGCTKTVYMTPNSEVELIIEGCVELHDLSKPNSLVTTINSSLVTASYDIDHHSFGKIVSMNDNFVIVGSPYSNNSSGSVFIFKSGSSGYVLDTVLSSSTTQLFGDALCLDKTYNTLVIGNGSITDMSSSVHLYEYVNNSWNLTKTFEADRSIQNLNFINVPQFNTVLSNPDGFGNSVSVYCSSSNDITVAIGAPYDRIYNEYSGSSCHRNGCVYIFNKINCISSSYWKQSKLYGDKDAFVHNRFGHAVDLSSDKIIISSPKFISEFHSSYIKDTLTTSIGCSGEDENMCCGMFYIYQNKDGNWDNVYDTFKAKKRHNKPYRFFAYDVAIYNDNIIVGSPVAVTDTDVSFDTTLTNVNGDFMLVNLADFETHHHVGNVFYKSGKIILSTSGSIVDDIFKNDINDDLLYDIKYHSHEQLYEKEIICTINPNEFNYSTNPSSIIPSNAILDLNNNGVFDFNDCDTVLRAMYKKIHGTEDWWTVCNFNSPSSFDEKVDASRFYYHVSSSFENKSQTALINRTLSDSDYLYITSTLNTIVDINGDGLSDDDDIRILWKYFSKTLSPVNYKNFVTNKKSEIRANFSDVHKYLNELTRGDANTILPGFNAKSSGCSDTGSMLRPYITTVGLYNGLSMVAVAKLGTPIKHEGEFPLNILVRFDI